MILKELTDILPKKEWILSLSEIKPIKNKLSQKQKKSILRELIESIEYRKAKRHIGKIVDLIHLGYFIGGIEFIHKIKRKGLLRHSSYVNLKNPIPKIIEEIQQYKSHFEIDNSIGSYFLSRCDDTTFSNRPTKSRALVYTSGVDTKSAGTLKRIFFQARI